MIKQIIQNRTGRIVAGLVPAAGLTFMLFWGMNQLVTVKDVKLADVTFRPMASLTPPAEIEEIEVRVRDQMPAKIEATPPPKQREIERIEPGAVVITLADYRVPETRMPTGATENFLRPVNLSDREEAIAVRAPVPEYPMRALQAGLEGDCEVVFSIDAAGRPFGASASCTNQVFERSSQRAVERALFATKVMNGVPVGQDNLVYPIQFTLNE